MKSLKQKILKEPGHSWFIQGTNSSDKEKANKEDAEGAEGQCLVELLSVLQYHPLETKLGMWKPETEKQKLNL